MWEGELRVVTNALHGAGWSNAGVSGSSTDGSQGRAASTGRVGPDPLSPAWHAMMEPSRPIFVPLPPSTSRFCRAGSILERRLMCCYILHEAAC